MNKSFLISAPLRLFQSRRSLLAKIGAILSILILQPSSFILAASEHFENPADFPLMGNWSGNMGKGELFAQVLCVDENSYRITLLEKLHMRAAPLLIADVPLDDGKLQIKQDGWDITFANGKASGTGVGKKKSTPAITLNKTVIHSPTLGKKAPPGATVLFNGRNFDQWEHEDGRPEVTWRIVDDAIEVVSKAWNNKQNEKDGIGGYIRSKKKFGDLKCHLEFRVPVEPGQKSQARGNSGFFFDRVEFQILNSYALQGLWNEAGAIYKISPPWVNAAAPPLQWQTYDVEVDFPDKPNGTAYFTAYLNGVLIQRDVPIELSENKAHIRLQDHSNAIQFRNIWVLEK